MDMLENLSLALVSLKANRMRTMLTLLGIVIGIASVIGIITVGSAMTDSITGSMQGMGASNITASIGTRSDDENAGNFMASAGVVLPGGAEDEGVQKIPEATDLITDQMILDLLEGYPDQIENVAASESVGAGQVKDGRTAANISITGTNSGYGAVNDITILSGRFVKDSDVLASRNVAVISDKLAKRIFGSAYPVGEQIKIYQGEQIFTFAVIGVYEYEESGLPGTSVSEKDLRTNLYIPVSTAKDWNGSDTGHRSVTIQTYAGVDTAAFMPQVQSYFDRAYARNPNFEVSASSMETLVNIISTVMNALSLGLTLIAAISLIVGGVGIMNILLVSITERTREIGIRKALGAKSSAIRLQFITESIIICLIGGAIGIASGILIGAVGSQIMGFQAHPSASTIFLALGVSMLIGVFFGYYPANKAARLDPIEALRYE